MNDQAEEANKYVFEWRTKYDQNMAMIYIPLSLAPYGKPNEQDMSLYRGVRPDSSTRSTRENYTYCRRCTNPYGRPRC